MGMSMGLTMKMEQKLEIQSVEMQWSFVTAYQQGFRDHAPQYQEPDREEESFFPVLVLERWKIRNFARLSHAKKLSLVDRANKVFRYADLIRKTAKKQSTTKYR